MRFFEYYSQFPEHFSDGEVLIWNQNQEKLSTDVGFRLWEHLIQNNTTYRRLLGQA